MTSEQQARDILERMDVNNAQSMTAGDVVELSTIIRNLQHAKNLLEKSRPYLSLAGHNAEVKYNDPTSESYQDYEQYETMTETQTLLDSIEEFLG